MLQADLDSLDLWCRNNNLPLNLSKCCQVTFTRKRHPLFHQYTINNSPLDIKSEIRDLGVILDSKLTFHPHINKMLKSIRSTIGFLYRHSQYFSSPDTLLTLYYALVRSRLEFASTIWHANTEKATLIEKVQEKFLRYLYKKQFHYYPFDIPYAELLEGYQLQSLSTRRKTASIMFISNILTNKIDDSYLLGKINIHVPRTNSRTNNTLNIPRHRTKFYGNSPILNAIRNSNNFIKNHPELDLLDPTGKRELHVTLKSLK